MPWIVLLLHFLDSLLAFFVLLTIFALWRESRPHPVDQSLASSGRFSLVLQTVGPRTPHSAQRCRITLYEMGRRRAKYNFRLPAGQSLTSRSWSISWMDDEALIRLPAITADYIVFLLDKSFACGVLPAEPLTEKETAEQKQIAAYRAIYNQMFRRTGCNFLPLKAAGVLTSIQLSLSGHPLEVLFYREDSADGQRCLVEHLQLDTDQKNLRQLNRFVYEYGSGQVTALGAETPPTPIPEPSAQPETEASAQFQPEEKTNA